MELVHALFGLELFAHAILGGGFVEGLVSGQGHFVLVPDSHHQQPPFRTIDRHLPDNLIKRLTEQLLPDFTDPLSPGLPMLQSLLQFLFQRKDIIS